MPDPSPREAATAAPATDASSPPEPSPAPDGAPAPGPAGAPGPPALAAVQTDTGRIVTVGTAVFALCWLVLLVARIREADWAVDHPTWLWTSLAGWVLGLMGLVVIGRHRRLGRTK